MYKDNFSRYPLFNRLGGGKHFMAWIGSRMKPHLVTESNYFYEQGDVIDNFYFGLKGISAFVIPKGDQMFAVIDPEKSKQINHSTVRVFQSFGCEDTVVAHAAKVHDENMTEESLFSFYRNGFKTTSKRYFTVQCITNSEVLTLSFQDIDRMKRDHKLSCVNFFKRMMMQAN